MRSILFILFGAILFTACDQSTPPEDVIDEETYKRMFAEFALINQLDHGLMQDTTGQRLRNMVYEHYGVTPDEFRTSHQYYEQQIDEQIERLKDINTLLRSERDTLVDIEREYRQALESGKLDSLRQALSDKE